MLNDAELRIMSGLGSEPESRGYVAPVENLPVLQYLEK